MSKFITFSLLLFFGVYLLTILVDFVKSRNPRKLLYHFFLLAGLFLVLFLVTGFPKPKQVISFGASSPWPPIILMFVFVILGMVSNYYFYKKEKFSASQLFKPFLISPIILMPLIGVIQKSADLEPMQLLSVALLAFQNGFFWREVMKKIDIKTS